MQGDNGIASSNGPKGAGSGDISGNPKASGEALKNAQQVRADPVDQIIPEGEVSATQFISPVKLTANDTNIFLFESVFVRKHILDEKVEGGWSFDIIDWRWMTRVQLYEHVVKWFVADVCGEPSIKLTAECIEFLNKKDQAVLIEAYKSYIRGCDKGAVIGWYAQDKQATGVVKSILQKGGIIKKDKGEEGDLLSYVRGVEAKGAHYEGFDGISRRRAWGYSGAGIAGHHIEDGWLHFQNWLVDLQLTYKGGKASDKALLVECAKRLSFRVWLFNKHSCTPAAVNELAGRIASMFRKAPDYWESPLHRRQFVLDPDWCKAHWKDMVEHVQSPGGIITSNCSHSVIGFTFLSMAWNVCKPSHLQHYIACEFEAARLSADKFKTCVDQNMWGFRGATLSFSLTVEVLNQLIMGAGFPPGLAPKVEIAAKQAALYHHSVAQMDRACDKFELMAWHDQCAWWAKESTQKTMCIICASPLVLNAIHAEVIEKALRDGDTSFMSTDSTMEVLLCGKCACRLADTRQIAGKPPTILPLVTPYAWNKHVG
jgi:hypothetical protein